MDRERENQKQTERMSLKVQVACASVHGSRAGHLQTGRGTSAVNFWGTWFVLLVGWTSGPCGQDGV